MSDNHGNSYPGLARLILMAVFTVCLVLPSFSAEFIILETSSASPNLVIEGNRELIEKKFSPASTFKIILAWAGLSEKIIDTATVIRCKDKQLPKGLSDLDLHQALIFSSNDYFVEIGKKLGLEKVSEYARNSGLVEVFPPGDYFPQGIKSVAHGGILKVTPREQHQFINKIMRGQLKAFPQIYRDLLDSMSWPSPDPKVKLFGKTGSGWGVVWFNGFGGIPGSEKAVTILMKGPVSLRDQVIAKFYSRFGLAWDESLLKQIRIAPAKSDAAN